jgi:hypothetical protein
MMFFPKSAIQWFRFSAFVLVAIAFLVYVGRSIRSLQFRLLYYPSSSSPSAELLQANRLKIWQSSGADYHGLLAADEASPKMGTVVVFHGNAGTAADRTYYSDALCALGYRVILAEYPMYGGRGGELGEKAFVGDARETIRLAFEECGGPIFLLGESMGCGIVAAAAAERPVPIEGIILITPWDTLEAIGRSKFPFFPVRLLLQDKYDSIGNLASFTGRVAVVGATRDAVIPIEHAKNLYASLPGTSKRLWIIQDAGHNDWNVHVNRDWWEQMMGFVSGSRR